jgi:hypothetical protein
MRVPPSDQMLDALMGSAKIALQLSLREGFEVKVSEALHAGKPIVASNTGGIPLQIQHGKSGFLTEAGDNETVAKHLFDLYTDDKLYKQMSDFARKNVSDEVGTVGNAAAWMYLAVSRGRSTCLSSFADDVARSCTCPVARRSSPTVAGSTTCSARRWASRTPRASPVCLVTSSSSRRCRYLSYVSVFLVFSSV